MTNELTQETKQQEHSTQFATSRTIKYLFAKIHARYGSKWSSQFPDDLWPLVQAEWLDELKEMTAEDIKRGLESWHEAWPPNVFEFSKACKKPTISLAHQEYIQIAPMKVTPEKAKENIKSLRKAISGINNRG